MRIAGTVILYNPSNNILKNIESYSDSLEFLLIFDNSSNDDARKYFQNNNKFQYIWQGENKGIAERLNTAIEICENKKIDFLIVYYFFMGGWKNAFVQFPIHLELNFFS